MTSPRSLFQKLHKEDATKLSVAVNESWFQRAVTYARAELSASGISQEQLSGVNVFLNTLTTLHEEQVPAKPMPDKSNLPSYEKPGLMPKEETEKK